MLRIHIISLRVPCQLFVSIEDHCLRCHTIFNYSIHPFDDAGRYGDNGYNDADSDTHSEDSNSESNFRNEYPDEDEDDDESVGERDMRRAANNLDIGMSIYMFYETNWAFINIE